MGLSSQGKALVSNPRNLQKADDDYGRRQQFNTVVSAVMELLNTVGKTDVTNDADRGAVQEAWVSAVLISIAPHIAHGRFGYARALGGVSAASG